MTLQLPPCVGGRQQIKALGQVVNHNRAILLIRPATVKKKTPENRRFPTPAHQGYDIDRRHEIT
jgi:7-keto-8-aminopelargonate synthetase-like enzyme